MTNDIGLAELARQVRDVLQRFQSLADRLDTTYVTKELFDLYQRSLQGDLESVKQNCAAVERDKAEKNSFDDLARRVANIEDNQKWLVRLLVSLIIVAVVGTVVVTGGTK